MALIWIGVAIGVLVILIIIAKLLRTPSTEPVKLEPKCPRCGSKLIHMKCPRCDKAQNFGV